MKQEIFVVDAFTDHLFGGNPAAVCPLKEWLDNDLMQNIAMENNLSETAFFVSNDNVFDIRWFTPKREINLAGHPTLATAWVIFNILNYSKNEIIFQSHSSGKLVAAKSGKLITLDFPANKPKKVNAFDELIEALGKKPNELYLGRDYLAVFESEEEVESLEPNFFLLNFIDAHGFIVTAPGNDSDFVSRFFAPFVGINEDPVTGSAHTTLIPYWSNRLKKKELLARQISKRGGTLYCRDRGDRVDIAGKSILYLKGEINI